MPIVNRDQCTVGSADVSLGLIDMPECDNVHMPNAFTPNNDRRNELLRPIHSPSIKNVRLNIYNRYGQLVFINSAQRPGWDGNVNGLPASQGTYVWTLSYETYQGVQKFTKGTVLLIR